MRPLWECRTQGSSWTSRPAPPTYTGLCGECSPRPPGRCAQGSASVPWPGRPACSTRLAVAPDSDSQPRVGPTLPGSGRPGPEEGLSSSHRWAWNTGRGISVLASTAQTPSRGRHGVWLGFGAPGDQSACPMGRGCPGPKLLPLRAFLSSQGRPGPVCCALGVPAGGGDPTEPDGEDQQERPGQAVLPG